MIKKHNKKITAKWVKYSEGKLKINDCKIFRSFKYYVNPKAFSWVHNKKDEYDYINVLTYMRDEATISSIYININKKSNNYKKIMRQDTFMYTDSYIYKDRIKGIKKLIKIHSLFKNKLIKKMKYIDLTKKIIKDVNENNKNNMKTTIEYYPTTVDNNHRKYCPYDMINLAIEQILENNNIKLLKILINHNLHAVKEYFNKWSTPLQKKVELYLAQQSINTKKHHKFKKINIPKIKSINNRNIRRIIDKYVGNKIF